MARLAARVTNYAEAVAALHGRTERKIGNNTYVCTNAVQDPVEVVLHHTAIASFFSDGTVCYNTGGYLTNTTKDRLRQVGCPVWQENGNFYVTLHGQTYRWNGRPYYTEGSTNDDALTQADPAEDRRERARARRTSARFYERQREMRENAQ